MLTPLRSMLNMMKWLVAPVQGVEPATIVSSQASPASQETALDGESERASSAPPPHRARAVVMLLLAIVISIAVIALTSRFKDALIAFGQLGLVGLFVLSVLGNATVLVPAPVFVVACAAGPIYGALATGLVAGFGAAVGEMTAYMAGYGGTAVLPQGKWYQRLHLLMDRFGPLVIFIMAVLPNPFFDVGGLIAGVLKMRPLVFLLATAAGKALRLTLIAYACTGGLPWLAQFLNPNVP